MQSSERLKIIEKIKELERARRFDEDVEDDPETRAIEPGEVDYLKKKLSSKIKTKYAYHIARKFLNNILKNKQMIVKEIKGTENMKNLTSGAIITCNHFNAFDSFAIQMAYEAGADTKKRKFYRVIREGNYTTFPGFFGFLMRNCYTLPLASNPKVMQEFLRATNSLLQQGHLVLIYPEQSMWWNYRKPKPLKKSAYQIAIKNKVPVLPCFITMQDTDLIDGDGFPVQEYTIHIGEPIYPDKDKTANDNANMMMKKNYELWKSIYESEYGIPLVYED